MEGMLVDEMTIGTVKGVAEAKTNNAMMWRYFTLLSFRSEAEIASLR